MRPLMILAVVILNLAADSPQTLARRQFADDKLGLMFHWGVGSLLGKGEWVMEKEALPSSQYTRLAGQFNPTKFDAEAWVKVTKGVGARYVVFTAKQHDGFCMYDSKLTAFDVVEATPYAKDPLKALAEACHKGGLKLVVYYSLLDWHHPDYFPRGESGKSAGRPESGEWSNYVTYYQGQLRELCTGYGPIAGVWLDGMTDRPGANWDLDTTYRLIHELQPQALIGNNHHRPPGPGEDFAIFEQDAPAQTPPTAVLKETVISLNNSWGYMARDLDYKSNNELVRLLVTTVARGSNLLINVSVKPDGTPPVEALERLTTLGQWFEAHGEAVRGTRPVANAAQAWGVFVAKSDVIYLHVFDTSLPITLASKFAGYDVRQLGAAERLTLTAGVDGFKVEIPPVAKPATDTILVIRPMSHSVKPAGDRP